jgi:phosphoribosylformylglycinamidine synthase subunit PurQ / glutaminase
MAPLVGVVTFPGSLDDRDALRAIRAAGAEPISLWHKEPSLHNVDAVVLPGGFSYGDYLRCGAIARFSPVMDLVIAGAREGLPVLGICNGFQVLCEAHLLPGALTRNAHLHFRCTAQPLIIENTATAWTNGYEQGARVVIPIKNGEGRFVADERTLDQLEADGLVVARYDSSTALHISRAHANPAHANPAHANPAHANPNGSVRDIAGITNERGNVVGLMPHPEHAIDPLTGPSADGLTFFTSIVKALIAA